MRKALIETASGRLCDIVLPGAEFPVSSGLQWVDAPDDVSHATHEWSGTEVIAIMPPPPAPPAVPQIVTRFQARAALHLAGLLPAVDALMADPATDMLARLAWQDATEFRRQSPALLAMSSALGLTAAQLDDLFTAAKEITA